MSPTTRSYLAPAPRSAFPRAIAIIAAGLALCAAPALQVHAATAADQTTPQGHDAPGPDSTSSGASAQAAAPQGNLSQQLNQSNGVITPPPTGDKGINTTVPDPNPGTTRVIPPPGTPGGDQSVQPK